MAIKTTQSTNRLRFIPLAQLPEAGSVEEQRKI